MNNLGEVAVKFGKEAFTNVKEELGERWNLLTEEQKDSAERATMRIVELELKLTTEQAAGQSTTETENDLNFVKVTVDEFKIAGRVAAMDTFQDSFWKGVNKALEALGSFLAGAGKSLVPGL